MSRAAQTPRRLPAAAALLLAMAALTGCESFSRPLPAQSAESRADAATWEACRRRADEVYEKRNRADIYVPYSGVNTPLSAGYAGGQVDRGLSTQFAYDQIIRECVRNTGTGAERSGATDQTPSAPGSLPTPPPSPRQAVPRR